MGHKSRGNYPSVCVRMDCENRDKKCDECIRFSEYKRKENAKAV